MRPLAYLVWIGSWSTLWKVSNRLRAVAEHGGMIRSRTDARPTHVIRQSWLARYWMVPYHTGWHLAHHVDMGVPWTNLPRLHERARRRRLGHARDRVPELPRLLARRVRSGTAVRVVQRHDCRRGRRSDQLTISVRSCTTSTSRKPITTVPNTV